MVDQENEKPLELVEESKGKKTNTVSFAIPYFTFDLFIAGGRAEVENEKEPDPPEPFMYID